MIYSSVLDNGNGGGCVIMCRKNIYLIKVRNQAELEQAVQRQRGQSKCSVLKLHMSLATAKGRLSLYSFKNSKCNI